MAKRNVFRFSVGNADGDKSMKDLLGGKGAGLAEMCRAKLNVPPGFTISTDVCSCGASPEGTLPESVQIEIEQAVAFIEQRTGNRLGDPSKPLLLSVRSGAAISMPGMMDTVLDLGMNDEVAEGLAAITGRPAFAMDCYRRFVDVFSNVVLRVPHEVFERHIDELKKNVGAKTDQDLSSDHLRQLVQLYKASAEKHTGQPFPNDPREQLRRSIQAVFRSWFSDRAVKYRDVQHIKGLAGTAVNVQAMVYGNFSESSGTGVLFTRNPSTGAPGLYGEYLIDAQGEDVVAGIRTPMPISQLQNAMPDVYTELREGVERLERHYKNMQDIEFTVQDGRLFFLQCRSGKRTGTAALKIASDFVREGIVTVDEAILNLVGPEHVEQVLHPRFRDEDSYRQASRVIAKGLPASPGAAVGRTVFTSAAAESWHGKGEKVILVRVETSPKDVGGAHASEGVLTARGGMTSHAAVIARGWGLPCVAGCGEIDVDEENLCFRVGEKLIKEGDWISLNGTTGEVIEGRVDLVDVSVSGDLEQVLQWADRVRRLGVRCNTDTPKDARLARSFGAQGIGLVRTERMFFAESRISHMRRMILAEDDGERSRALESLISFQRQDFSDLFRVMNGLPVTIRVLDPPLHEFLPTEPAQLNELAKLVGMPVEHVVARVSALKEVNPMLGHRGCRLGITTPDVTAMQARAIFEAACGLKKEGLDVHPEVMVPLVGSASELKNQREIIERVARQVMSEMGVELPLNVGTMIEVPRGALTAGQIAEEAAFFSFGTNDLTQMTFGFSRDDVASFLPKYLALGIVPDDPFQTIDRDGVGQLVRVAVERGRAARPGLSCGICGEHGGDPRSIHFFEEVGLDYVSCSAFRVPVARLAAAQAVLAKRKLEDHHH
jgi:pyruvate,orthophosphate dikinase